MTPLATEADLIAQERQWWHDGEWSNAITSFLSRWLFLPLLSLRDAARPRSRVVRCLAGVAFYPSYSLALGAWLLAAAALFLLSPLLFLFAHGWPKRS